jgi:thiamine kinase-like enzyme
MDTTRKPSSATEPFEAREVRRRLAALPGFRSEDAAEARVTRLVGFTNRVYKVETGRERLCLRIPGTGAAAMVDRRTEEVNARLAARAGVAPEVVHFGDDGVMVTRFVEDAVPLLPGELTEEALRRGALALRRLHEAEIVFASRFDAFAFIDSYLDVLARLRTPLADEQRGAVATVQAIRPVLAATTVSLKPCHCDPTGRNLLDTGERVWLVDWEYSGMNDPMWDLAYFSIESRLDDRGDRNLTEAYFGRGPRPSEAARMALWKPVCEVVAALWALIQVGEGTTGGDFSGYAEASFARAATRMRAADFAHHIEALRKG